MNAGPRQRLITPPGARRLGSVVSGNAHLCACVIRGEARDHVRCDAPRFCGIPSKWNIERQLIITEKDAALTSIGSRECDESVHLARGPNFEFHARSIRPYLRDGRSRSGDIRERLPNPTSATRDRVRGSLAQSPHDLRRVGDSQGVDSPRSLRCAIEGFCDPSASRSVRSTRNQDAAKSTSFASTVPAVRPGASWLPQ